MQGRQKFLQGQMFQPAEFGFPAAAKDLGNRRAGTFFDGCVEINKPPSQAMRQSLAYEGLPGTHESHQEDSLRGSAAHARRMVA